MPRDMMYVLDRLSTKGHRQRVVIMPAGSDIFNTPGTQPEWRETNEYDWLPLADGAITFPTPTEAQGSFEKYVVGMANTPIYKQSANFARLYRNATEEPDADAQDLAGYIRNYIYPDGGTYAYTSAPLTSSYRTFDTTNVWWILTDDGDSSKTISQFRTVFCGVQSILPEKEGSIITGQTVTQDIELRHIGRAALESVLMTDVCEHVVNTYDHHATTDYDFLFDTAFSYSGAKFGWGWRLYPDEAGGGRFYKFADIFRSIETLATRALIGWLRGDWNDSGDLARISLTLRSLAATSGGATPWDHWTFYEQTGEQTTNRGDALDRDDVYVLGEVLYGSDRIGGLFHPSEDKASLAREGYTAWDFLEECGSAALAKMRFVQQDMYSLYLRIMAPREGDSVDLTRASLRTTDASKPLEVPYVESYEVIANAAVSLDGGYGDDCQPPVEVKNFGSQAEQGGTATTMFDCVPGIGEKDQWKHRAPYDLSLAFEGLSLASYNIPLRKLWYFTDLDSLLPFTSPVRVHHAPAFGFGNGTYSVVDPITLPEDTSIDTYGDAEAWRDAMRVALAQTYRTDGQTAMLANVMIQLFGFHKQTKYQFLVPANLATVNDIGDRYRITPASGGHYSAQPLVNSAEVDISDLPGVCWLLSTKIDDDTYLAEIELVGVSYS